MTEADVIGLGQNALYTALLLAAPMLGLSLLVGLLVSVFQAATQIQEQTLAFIPKIVAVFVALAIFSPWMLRVMVDYAARLLRDMPGMVG